MLFHYYRIQVMRNNENEALIAAYTLIFRFNKHPLVAVLQKELQHSDIKSANELTPSQREDFEHFRRYYLARLPEKFQKEWLTSYYLLTNQIDSLSWLAKSAKFQEAAVELFYYFVKSELYIEAKEVLRELNLNGALKDSMISCLESIAGMEYPHEISFTYKSLIPGYYLIRRNKKYAAIQSINVSLLMLGNLAAYVTISAQSPLISIPYALSILLYHVAVNHDKLQSVEKLDYEKLFPKELIKNNLN